MGGFVCTYGIEQNNSFQKELEIRFEDEKAPLGGSLDYEHFHLPINYDGEMLLGAGLDYQYHMHIGFQSSSAFQTVLHLAFSASELTDRRDLSEETVLNMAGLHEITSEDLLGWVKNRFSLMMEMR